VGAVVGGADEHARRGGGERLGQRRDERDDPPRRPVGVERRAEVVDAAQRSVTRMPACALYRLLIAMRFAVNASTWPGVAQPAGEDAAHPGDPARQRLHHRGGVAVLGEDEHVQVDLVDLGVGEQRRADVVESRADPGVGQQRGGLLGGAALRHLQRVRALLVEAERVHAVDHDPAGQRRGEVREQVGVAGPRNGDDDHVGVAGVGVVAAGQHPVDGARQGGQLGGGLGAPVGGAGADAHPLAGAGQPVGQAPPLVAGAAEDADGQPGNVGQCGHVVRHAGKSGRRPGPRTGRDE
jgi:hypothetical protein